MKSQDSANARWSPCRLRNRAGARGATLAAILAFGGAAGCGSETDSADSERSSTRSASANTSKCGLANGKAATGTPINVGAVVTASGGVDFSSAAAGAKALFDCVNANGGINGRPVKYLTEDDAVNPEKAGAAAAKLLDDEDVVALVGSTSFVDCAVNGPVYAEKHVLAIYGTGVPQQCFESPNIAPVNTGPRISAIGAAQRAVQQGARKLALVTPKLPGVGEWVADGMKDYAAAKNVELVKTVFAAPGLKDATSVVLDAASAKPDAIIFVVPGPDNAALLKAAEQQQLKGRIKLYCPTSCYDASLAEAVGPYWGDELTADSEFQLLDADTPDNNLWREVMERYAPKDARQDSFSQGGMLAAKIFADTLLEIEDPATIDRKVATEAIRAIDGYRSDLICSPFYFGEGKKHNPNHATRLVSFTGTGWEKAQDCFETEDPAVGEIRQAEG